MGQHSELLSNLAIYGGFLRDARFRDAIKLLLAMDDHDLQLGNLDKFGFHSSYRHDLDWSFNL